MKSVLEKILPQSWVDSYKEYRNKHSAESNRRKWEQNGKPLPPPHTIKQEAIQQYQKKSAYRVLVETGTYKGDMMLAQKDFFKKLYSIELSPQLYQRAKKRFRKYPHVTLLQGNSGEVISRVLKELQEPAIFWLDGHYSGGITASSEKHSPINEELQAFIDNNRFQHIILIDDARVFTGENGYPTIEEAKEMTTRYFPGYHFSVEEDIIRLAPKKFS